MKPMDQNILAIYTYIREYRVRDSFTLEIIFIPFVLQENDIGLIAPFLELPSAEEYPDYYETIEQPIDMTMIKEKIDKNLVNKSDSSSFHCEPSIFSLQYKREQDLIDDLNRMFKNAKIYNVDESYIFKYASRLEQALASKCKSMNIKKEKIHRIINKRYVFHFFLRSSRLFI